LARLKGLQIDDLQLEVRRKRDDLHRLTINGAEGGAQDLVTRDDLLEAALQRLGIEPAANPDRAGHIVGRITWSELIQKPQALLGERERQVAVAAEGLNRRQH